MDDDGDSVEAFAKAFFGIPECPPTPIDDGVGIEEFASFLTELRELPIAKDGGHPALLERRARIIETVLDSSFTDGVNRTITQLRSDIKSAGVTALKDHVTSCGFIPERLPYNSTAEKVFTKYTEAVVASVFQCLGGQVTLTTQRADAADLTVAFDALSFVVDAKSMRFSRSAKNQKDFKIDSVGQWRGSCERAVIVATEFPTGVSQVYPQSARCGVSLLSYCHLLCLLDAFTTDPDGANRVMRRLMMEIPCQRDGAGYWMTITSMIERGWATSVQSYRHAIRLLQTESMAVLDQQEADVATLSHEEAIAEVLRLRRFEQRRNTIEQAGLLRFLDF